MGVYTYDLEELEQTRDGLRRLCSSFEAASRRRGNAEGALGYSSLRSAMRAFTDNWDHEREKQVEALDGAATSLTEICANYRELDRVGVASLCEQG